MFFRILFGWGAVTQQSRLTSFPLYIHEVKADLHKACIGVTEPEPSASLGVCCAARRRGQGELVIAALSLCYTSGAERPGRLNVPPITLTSGGEGKLSRCVHKLLRSDANQPSGSFDALRVGGKTLGCMRHPKAGFTSSDRSSKHAEQTGSLESTGACVWFGKTIHLFISGLGFSRSTELSMLEGIHGRRFEGTLTRCLGNPLDRENDIMISFMNAFSSQSKLIQISGTVNFKLVTICNFFCHLIVDNTPRFLLLKMLS